MNRIFLLLAVLTLPVTTALAEPEESADKARAIMLESEHRNFDRYGDLRLDEEVIVENRWGKEVTRHLKVFLLEVLGEGEKGLIVFQSPADVKGVASLFHTHKKEADDMWMFFPRQRRIRRVSTDNKGGAFMGTDFSIEDAVHYEPEKYTYSWLREEIHDGEDCFVIERFPLERSSTYSSQVIWIDKKHYRVLKADHYNRRGRFTKTLHFFGYKEYFKDHWRPGKMKMINHVDQSITRVLMKNWSFNVGLRESVFTLNGLRLQR